jgi:hypothetical protein
MKLCGGDEYNTDSSRAQASGSVGYGCKGEQVEWETGESCLFGRSANARIPDNWKLAWTLHRTKPGIHLLASVRLHMQAQHIFVS